MGFRTPEGRIVQSWFDSLRSEAKGEIADICQSLQIVTARRWGRPEFDPLIGAGGISEIRPCDVRTEEGCFTYRIYGFFGPEPRQYTLLHGTLKTQRNDYAGKRIARERREYVLLNGASAVHKFDFSG